MCFPPEATYPFGMTNRACARGILFNGLPFVVGLLFLGIVACEEPPPSASSEEVRVHKEPKPPDLLVPPTRPPTMPAIDSDANPDAPLEADIRLSELQRGDVLPEDTNRGRLSPRSDRSSLEPAGRHRPPSGQVTPTQLWNGR